MEHWPDFVGAVAVDEDCGEQDDVFDGSGNGQTFDAHVETVDEKETEWDVEYCCDYHGDHRYSSDPHRRHPSLM